MGTLTTRASVKELLGIKSSVTAYDAVIDTLVLAVDGLVEDYCDRHFADTTYTEYHDGESNQRKLLVRNYPLISVTSIHDDAGRTYGSDTLIASADYTFETGDDADGIVYLDLSLARGQRNVKIVYRAGYATIPKTLSRAADLVCASIYNRRKGAGRSNESLGNLSYSAAPEMWGDAVPILARFKRWA